MKLRVLELFGGIGACSKALERLGIDYEIADYVEIDKYAVKSFNAIHGTNFEPQDICTWNKDIDVDLIMHGSPCQDFSVAGKGAGGDEGSGTRSSLMYETIRIVERLKPKYVIWENVKNVISKKHRHNFDNYLSKMEELGYINYWQVLNAKDYGIPQNRERVFTISILGKDNYDFPVGEKCENKIQRKYGLYNQATRWGVYDKNGLAPTITASMGMGGGHVPMIENFDFPPKQELKLKLKDLLEESVDEKYFLSEAMLNYMYGVNQKPSKFSRRERFEANINRKNQDVANSVTTNAGNRPTDNFIKINNGTKKGYLEAYDGDSVNLSYPNSKTRRGRVGEQVSQTLQCNDSVGVIVMPQTVKVRKHKVNIEKLKKTLKLNKKYTNKEIASKLNVSVTTVEHWFRNDNSFSIPIADIWFDLKKLLNIETEEFDKSITEFEEKEGVYEKSNRYYLDNGIAPTLTHASASEKIISDLRIRKLTPKECWRLMGFDDEDFEKASQVCSNTQLYKQAGNSIVVNVLEAIFKNLFLD